MIKSSFDVCVVGSGPSSLALVAGILKRNPRARILVLEAGDNRFSVSHLGERKSSMQSFKLNPTINIGYGGTSQLWHNVLAPLDPSDFLSGHLDKRGDWLINYEDLKPHYESIAGMFSFDFSIFDRPHDFFNYDEHLKRISFDDNIFQPKVFVHPQQYLRCDAAFRKLEANYTSLSVKLGAEVLRYSEAASEVIVTYKDIKEVSKSFISCGSLVLCAGALNNPLIIYRSTPKDELPMLGRCLMDHPMGNMFQFRYPKKKTAPLFSAIKVKRGLKAKVALRFRDDFRVKNRLLNSAFYLRPSFSEGPDDATERLKLDLLTVRKKLMSGKIPVREGLGLVRNINMLRQVLQYKTGLSDSHTLSDCMLVTEQLPNILSQVEIKGWDVNTDDANVDVQWRLSKADLDQIEILGELINEGVIKQNAACMTYDRGTVRWESRLASAAHHLGTVRMSRDSVLGCVNGDLRLHNSKKIFVCDGSVFPTSGNANPTFTCMALGDRLGGYLADG